MEYTDKQERILDAAADLFARQPFHKVLLSDVARTAAVGKGTLYLYFNSKEDLYFAVLYREFDNLLTRLKGIAADPALAPDAQLSAIVGELARHFLKKAANMDMQGVVLTCPSTDDWRLRRAELLALIEAIIRRGVAMGMFHDQDPRLTAKYIPGLLRGACHFEPQDTDIEAVSRHAASFVLQGLAGKD
ncbi:TetR/AcrR family transcriptional regulator [Pseudodesulfovibrio sp.]|uniref:TetR/AcrR family transcriptional regulator n=1 Tax=Pseudodesulfovibrio sp. TaxID=2035812 RepID=UPI00261F5BBD|nr:TetR/AcrR family transcriptional regulator [Pseudodesulfovibrio sp.]MDD3313044.1 TetR/AcrR family transcriptional regulator [Pseudodesulfovibrio sp.]